MSPLAHYTDAFRRYADFRGRTGRPGYWYFSLLSMLAWFAVSLVSAGLGALYVLAAFLPTLGVTIRRLHDTDRSGWWCLVSLLPVVGTVVMLVFLVGAGTQGGNHFGDAPGLQLPDRGDRGHHHPAVG